MSDNCLFCRLVRDGEGAVAETEHFVVIVEPAPVSPGHLLIVTKVHYPDAFGLPGNVWADFEAALKKAKEFVCKNHSPDGFNVGMNCGLAAGQTRLHYHAHVIPRYKGDVEGPTGGVRNIMDTRVPPKMDD